MRMDSCSPCAKTLVRASGRGTVCSFANTNLPEMRPHGKDVDVLVHHKRCVFARGLRRMER
jgi:hypothetical protein